MRGTLMKIEGDNVIFSTGKIIYANLGVIGLSPKDECVWRVREGYDGTLCEFSKTKLTQHELVELADYMITLWQEFRADQFASRIFEGGRE